MALVWRYLPILKWKRGEQFALRNLTAPQWNGIVPLIELQPVDAAPDGASLKAALPAYAAKIALEIDKAIPEDQPIFIGTCYVSPGYPRQASLLAAVCDLLQRKTSRPIFPVIDAAVLESLGALTNAQAQVFRRQAHLLLRLRTNQIEPIQVAPFVAELIASGVARENLHILIDQHALVDRDPADCVTMVRPYLDQAVAAGCASVTIGGGAFPMYLRGFRQGATDIPRVEWQVWERLLASADYFGLRYADYAVTNPAPLPDIDGTAVNPSIAIRYAADGFWRLLKGRGFKSGVPGEHRNLCKLLITDPAVYSGEAFSYGDGQYKAAANGGEKNGSPWTWRRDATSHHLVFTASSL